MEGTGSRRGRPKKPGGRMVKMSIRLDPKAKKALLALAERRHCSVGSIVQAAVDRELDLDRAGR